MRTLHRYFYRIFLPILVVALIAVVFRYIMVREFHEKNVRPVPASSPTRSGGGATNWEGGALAYSEENKESVVADLHASMDQLRAAPKSEASPEEAERLEEQAEESIQRLRQADEQNWQERLDAAYKHLREYAEFVGAEA